MNSIAISAKSMASGQKIITAMMTTAGARWIPSSAGHRRSLVRTSLETPA